jgi:putative FmdB family regulatory protein
MPLYEYQCEQCGVRFEVIQKFSDTPVESCKSCGGKVQRLLSAPAIHFKGTGWYITDYARKGSGGETPSSSPATSTSAPAASGSTAGTSDSSGSGSPGSTPAPSPAPSSTTTSDKK